MESLEVKMNMSVAEKLTSLTNGNFFHSMKVIVLEMICTGHPLSWNGNSKLMSSKYVGQKAGIQISPLPCLFLEAS